jgi:hypothetical protein
MTNLDFSRDRERLAQLVATGDRDAVDRLLAALHVKYHDRPGDHVRVHVAWMRVQLARRAYLRAAFHAFAGFVVAGPASLVQRYTGVVVPAFDAERKS